MQMKRTTCPSASRSRTVRRKGWPFEAQQMCYHQPLRRETGVIKEAVDCPWGAPYRIGLGVTQVPLRKL